MRECACLLGYLKDQGCSNQAIDHSTPGAVLLSQLLHHTPQALSIPTSSVFTWTDSTIVLSWLNGNPRQMKTFVGNRVSNIMQFIPPDCQNHVSSPDNPADCASRGLFPTELLNHELWWKAPDWLRSSSAPNLVCWHLSCLQRKKGTFAYTSPWTLQVQMFPLSDFPLSHD